MPAPFDAYIASIAADLKGGHATEHTYRPALEQFMEAVRPGVKASNDPKHIECGAPDFIIEKGKVPLGYVETKDVGADLDKVEKSEQVKRYLKALNNLILTDYLEFRWYVNGVKKRTLSIAKVGKNGKLEREENAALNLEQLFKDFYAQEAPTVTSPRDLATRLAGVAHFIREQIVRALTSGDPAAQQGLEKRLNAFRELLLPAMRPEEFADLYAQAMTYGLFAAKLATPLNEKFSLLSAYQYLGGNGFLRKLFMDVSEELDEIEIIRPYLQDIVSLLNRADFTAILATFGQRTRTEDPVVHFYETFLAAYDPKLRESRGVYYTPEPVVQFIVRSVDELLKTRFGKPWGLADSSVKVLDPATGTGTFLYFVIQQIHDEVVETRKQAGQWPQASKELLGRLFGFELLMAPYVVAHLKLGMQFKELGAPLGKHDRVQVYLTNTLEEGISRAEHLAGLGNYIAEESSEAAQVKKQEDIMVVLGNPPYSYESTNNGPWITSLIRDYYKVDGAPLGEANPKGLQDDYVKFIRFGEWRINQTGHGILAFITNHAYLDNPTFRGMRRHLMQTFDEIYLLDLHGNSKKKEKAPDGGKDENVFDIQQGVAILIALKNLNKGKHYQFSEAIVNHADIWGLRAIKYSSLQENSYKDIDWVQLKPSSPFYLFTPQDTALLPEYLKGWKITEVFPLYSVGIVTSRDDLSVHWNPVDAYKVLSRFISISPEEARREFDLGDDSRDWKILLAQNDLKKTKLAEKYLVKIHYRPFDVRYTYYTGNSRGFHSMPRQAVMRHMVKDNLALLTSRITKGEDFAHVQVTENISEKIVMSPKTSNNGFHFPLYLYTTPEETAGTLFAQAETTRQANLSPAFLAALSAKLGMPYVEDPDPHPLRPAGTSSKSAKPDLEEAGRESFGPEDVFHYAYAVFHSPAYRSRYAEFLKIDFPRLPLTGDRALFFALAEKGRQLVALHLLKTPLVEEFITAYPAAGDNRVEKAVFAPDARRPGLGRVQINARQYFDGVPEAVWAFKIGGYQVCEKWLKDRKGRVLGMEDINDYQRVIVALQGTIRLMAEIDATIPAWPME